jgi:hypothetical protein
MSSTTSAIGFPDIPAGSWIQANWFKHEGPCKVLENRDCIFRLQTQASEVFRLYYDHLCRRDVAVFGHETIEVLSPEASRLLEQRLKNSP